MDVSPWYWAIMFLVCRVVLFRKFSSDFSNRVVSIVHAFAAIYYSYVTFVTWEGMFDGGARRSSALIPAFSLPLPR